MSAQPTSQKITFAEFKQRVLGTAEETLVKLNNCSYRNHLKIVRDWQVDLIGDLNQIRREDFDQADQLYRTFETPLWELLVETSNKARAILEQTRINASK